MSEQDVPFGSVRYHKSAWVQTHCFNRQKASCLVGLRMTTNHRKKTVCYCTSGTNPSCSSDLGAASSSLVSFHAPSWSGSMFTLGHEKGSAHFDDSYAQEASDRVNELDLAQFGWAGRRWKPWFGDLCTCHTKRAVCSGVPVSLNVQV